MTSTDLQKRLEISLRANLDVNGSLEYVLTWKNWGMQSGQPICALRARGHRTSDSDYSGELQGWPTPNAGPQNIGDTTWQERRAALKTKHKNGNGFGMTLGQAVTLTGWPTPNAISENRGGLQTNPEKALERRAQGHMLNLDDAATLASWNAPRATDGSNGGPNQTGGALSHDVSLASGQTTTSSPALTEKRGALDPAFSLWLMGFPIEWLNSAPLATRSSRR